MTRVKRFDNGVLERKDAVALRDSGIVIYDATFTRVGVFTYVDPVTGEEVNELRHPDDVFDPDSLNTLRLVPFTNDHPSQMLTIDTVKDHRIGNLGDSIWCDNVHVYGRVSVEDRSALDKINAGKIETSCGYYADIEELEAPARWDGPGQTGTYTQIQRRIRYNHVALVDAGRAGTTSLKKDSQDSPASGSVARFDTAIQTARMDRAPISQHEGTTMTVEKKDKKDVGPETVSVKIRGVEFTNVPKDLAVVLSVMGVTSEGEAAPADKPAMESDTPPAKPEEETPEAGTTDSVEQAKKDALLASLANEKAKKDAAGTKAKIDAAVAARVDLERSASRYVKDAAFQGKTDTAIMREAIAVALPSVKLDGKDDAYIATMWDFVKENVKADSTEPLAAAIGNVAAPSTTSTPKRDSAWSNGAPRLAVHT